MINKQLTYEKWLLTTMDPSPRAAWDHQAKVITSLKEDWDKAVYTANEALVQAIQSQNIALEESQKYINKLQGENSQLRKELEEATGE